MAADLREAIVRSIQRKLNSFGGNGIYIMRGVRMMWKPVKGKSILTGESSADRIIKSFDDIRANIPADRHREALNLVIQIAKFEPHEIVLGAKAKAPPKRNKIF